MIEKVTVEALRNMKIGETKVFHLANARAIEAGKALAYRTKHLLKCRFTVVSNFANNELVIRKIEL